MQRLPIAVDPADNRSRAEQLGDMTNERPQPVDDVLLVFSKPTDREGEFLRLDQPLQPLGVLLPF